jgi:hypothetical protein
MRDLPCPTLRIGRRFQIPLDTTVEIL